MVGDDGGKGISEKYSPGNTGQREAVLGNNERNETGAGYETFLRYATDRP